MGVDLSDYRDALEFLFARTTGKWKFGLERTEAVLGVLGDPHRGLPTLHVAGTNGKGSVVATLDALLGARGLRVGRYTSPHLVDFRERILIAGKPVAEEAIVSFIRRWTPAVEEIGATFFEATTAMALDIFAREEVDIAVIETGLGGRLDATNVIRPLAAGVTSIGIDHVEYLGDTLEAIAFEKAGIFKPGVPALIGEPTVGIRALLSRLGRERGASVVRAVADETTISDVEVSASGTSFTIDGPMGPGRLTTPLAGRHQAVNATLALTMIDAVGGLMAAPLTEAAAALRSVSLPGRFHRSGKFILDVAHNPAGVAVLVETVRTVAPEPPVFCLLSVLSDKDWKGIMDALQPAVSRFVLTTAPTSPASRAWHPEEAKAYADDRGWPADLVPDFDRALFHAESEAGTLLITGSFHTVGDAMSRLQVSPLGG